MLVLAMIVFGMLVGAAAQLILGKPRHRINWTQALTAGLVGSFVGGLLLTLLSGDGVALRPSGLIGSLVGALLVTALWGLSNKRHRKAAAAARAARRSGDPRKSHPQSPPGATGRARRRA